MKKTSISIKPLFLAIILSCLTILNTYAEQGPAENESENIRQASPEKPSAKIKKHRKVLVFSISWGYRHSAIDYGKAALDIMGKKSGAFDAVVSDDLSNFEWKNIKQFDAIIFNNTNCEIFLPENFEKLADAEKQVAAGIDKRLKRNLVKFIKSGKGLAVIHAGVASLREWPEYENIIGARFDNHPWGAGSTVTLKVDDPRHPVAQAFKEPYFTVTDEIYQLTGPYSRDTLRVLISINTEKTNMKVEGIHRTDNDFGISWVKSYGKGRVFYCALGHQHELFWNPVVLQHFLDGIQFTLGDLQADTIPSAKLKETSCGNR